MQSIIDAPETCKMQEPTTLPRGLELVELGDKDARQNSFNTSRQRAILRQWKLWRLVGQLQDHAMFKLTSTFTRHAYTSEQTGRALQMTRTVGLFLEIVEQFGDGDGEL